jgi:hypothetical protein
MWNIMNKLFRSVLVIIIFQLTACGSETNIAVPDTRLGKWEQDIDVLVSKMESVHPSLYHKISKQEFYSAALDIKVNIGSSTDQEMFTNVLKLVATPGTERDGHMFVAYYEGTSNNIYPIKLYRFSDGVYVIQANTQYQHLVGTQLISIEGRTLDDINNLIDPLITRDNENSLIPRRNNIYI